MALNKIWTRPRTLAGILVVIVVMGGALYNETLPPQIHSIPVPGDGPFTLRFSVSNPAFTTTMKDMDFTCVPLELHGRSPKGEKLTLRADPFALNVDIDLPPRAAFQYTCPIRNAGLAASIDSVDAKVSAAYTRFGHRSLIWSGELTWDSASRIWAETTS
jgi:hypothetical protein